MIDTGEKYERDEYPGWRVRIYYDEDAGAPHMDWDMIAGDHQHRDVMHTWDRCGMVGVGHVLGQYQDRYGMTSEELSEYLPTTGVVIGLDYADSVHGPGTGHVRPHWSEEVSEWDGYFHVTRDHWQSIMGDTPMTSDAVREALENDCKVITAWMQGQVFGWVLERETTWTNDAGESMTTWEDEDSCWGYYGLDEWDYMAECGFDAIPADQRGVPA